MPKSRLGLLVLVVGLLAAGLALGYALAKHGAKPKAAPGSTQHLADTATVLVAVRGLARLESVAFHMERVIDLKERQARLFGLIEADDAILLVAAGDVVAGIDLGKMHDGDVQIDPVRRSVRMLLPAPELLSVRLDNDRTYVHTRHTDLLARRGIGIETEARRHAESSIRAAALEAGILARAQQGAEHTLTALARSLGYDHVELVWPPRPAE
jgi:uncharacterized protein DUF4230